jgi:imidazolonepropionase
MAELGIVPKGALLINNGVIREAGPTRRVENLAEARHAHEIDATGCVVMPAFVDADVALVNACAPHEGGPDSIRLMSRRRVLAKAAARSEELARYGCLAAGAHTRCAGDLKNISRLLRAHRTVQGKPLRIRSIFSPIVTPDLVGQLISKWLPTVISQKLAAVLELTVGGPGNTPDMATMREVLVAAAGFGYAIRLRSPWRAEPAQLELAVEAGAVGVVAPMDSLSCFASRLTEAGTIRVIPVSQGEEAAGARQAIRCAVGQGAAVALASGVVTLNMQHVLWLGVQNFGLTSEEAIMATTWNAACSLRLSRVIGSLEPGKSADLLVMDVDDYRELASRGGHRDAGVVMRDGQIVQRNATPRMDSGSALSLD